MGIKRNLPMRKIENSCCPALTLAVSAGVSAEPLWQWFVQKKQKQQQLKKKQKQSGRMISEVLCRHVISLFSQLPANDPLECYNVHFWSGFGRKLFTWNHDEISLLAGQEGPRLARVPGEPLKVSHLPLTARFIRHNYTISGGGASAAFAPLHGWEVTQTLRFPPPLRMRWGRINARLNKKQDVNSGGGGRRLITSRH